MSTFILGVSAAIVVGMFVWFTLDTIKSLKRIKQLENETTNLYREINERFDIINRQLDQLITDMNLRVDDNYRYTDSRLDKMANVIERDYVAKKNKLDNTINYNN
jgi:predicted PurR-regulated permease PerM